MSKVINPITVITSIAILITTGVFCIAHDNYETRSREYAEAIASYESEIKRQCQLAFPESTVRQIHCFEESQ